MTRTNHLYPILPTPSQAPTGRLLQTAKSSLLYKSSLYKGGALKRSPPLEYPIVCETCLKTSNPLLLIPIGFPALTSESTYPCMTVVGPTGTGRSVRAKPPHIGPHLPRHPFLLFTPSPLSNPFPLPVVIQSLKTIPGGCASREAPSHIERSCI